MFSLVIPIFNEEKNIKSLLEEVTLFLKDYKNYEILLVNDASTDNSINEIKKLNNNKISLINNSSNKGQSFSINEGIKNSVNSIIITLDGDGQNDPKDIPKLLNHYLANEDVKLVGGIRKKRKDNLIKILSSKVANFVRSKILSDNCKDTGCSLKIFDRDIFLSLDYFNGMHRFLPALFKGYGYKTYFIDVNHRERKYGFSKYGTFNRLFKGINDMLRVYKILKKIN